jgi:hypothetical protein
MTIHSDNCDIVLEKTPQLLHAAFAICFVVSFMMLFFSCISCGSICCPNKCCGPPDATGSEHKDPLMTAQEVHSPVQQQQQQVHVVVAEEVHESTLA